MFCHSNLKLKTRKEEESANFLKTGKLLCVNDVDFVKKIDLVTCTHNQKGKYELDIVNIEKQICESHRAEKKQEEIRAVTCIKSNSNYFFKYAKKHSHTISHIGPLLNPLLHAIRNNGIRFFSFWNSKENVSNKVIPKKKILICCE